MRWIGNTASFARLVSLSASHTRVVPATLEAMMKGLCRMKTNIVARLKNKVLERDMA